MKKYKFGHKMRKALILTRSIYPLNDIPGNHNEIQDMRIQG